MAVDTVIISDSKKLHYLQRSPESGGKKAMSETLEAAAELDLKNPFIFVNGEALRRIRKAVGATVDTAEALASAVEKACSAKVGETSLDVNPLQRRLITDMGAMQHRSYEEQLKEICEAAIKEKTRA